MKPETTKSESMKPDHMKSDGTKTDTIKSGHMESDAMKPGHAGDTPWGPTKVESRGHGSAPHLAPERVRGR
jgi:hypothetical protein